ncbi:OsmC family protein [Symplocastrum sp. BBK-W-15]|uniref:OsmC family protein n=1 Tax=Limnofasciculus baicalensis BBK-W-15 TaxID=2699891 RepID=A0AAE3GTB8_9CYAN|nr:OsmC family protein [Limnofasciculus baicalensis]MCP2729627.1 OsmC family protein [Limnofasciculus baicalensis BBK-W-15]
MAAQQAKFTDNKYSREHSWKFDGGAEIAASASPHIVPLPYSNPAYIDPEKAFIASLSSCHMLWFLSIAAKHKFIVDSYVDRAIGLLDKNEEGKLAITKVNLRPHVIFTGDNLPTDKQIEEMHETAHHNCFIANSVKTEILIEMVAFSPRKITQ